MIAVLISNFGEELVSLIKNIDKFMSYPDLNPNPPPPRTHTHKHTTT